MSHVVHRRVQLPARSKGKLGKEKRSVVAYISALGVGPLDQADGTRRLTAPGFPVRAELEGQIVHIVLFLMLCIVSMFLQPHCALLMVISPLHCAHCAQWSALADQQSHFVAYYLRHPEITLVDDGHD